MWDEIEIRVRTMDFFKTYLGEGNILLGEGNKKAKYLLIFLDFKDEALKNSMALTSKTMNLYKKMLNLTKIDLSQIYITSIYKLDKSLVNISNKNLEELIDILLLQINLINPEYILAIGNETFNLMVNIGLNLDYKTNKVDIFKCLGNRYDFFSKILIPILDEEELKKAHSFYKKKIVDSLLIKDRSI